jgi:biofilm protein TabA
MFNFENKNKMRSTFTKIMLMATILSFFGCRGNTDPSTWSESKTNEWFNKGEWRNGWTVAPDPSINKKALALSYFKNKERWDKAFNFLKSNDLPSLELKKHVIDGENLFVNVSEYNTKEAIDAKFEAHRKYIDIQYVIKGTEMIGVAPLASKDSITQPYDETKDVEFLKFSNETFYQATPANFFIFFPDDGHMPSVKTDSISPVKKLVVKIRID